MTFSNAQKRAFNLSKRDLRIARQNKQFDGTGDLTRYVRDAVTSKPQEAIRGNNRHGNVGQFDGSISGRAFAASPDALKYVLKRVNAVYDRTGVLPSVSEIQGMI